MAYQTPIIEHELARTNQSAQTTKKQSMKLVYEKLALNLDYLEPVN